MFYDKTTSLLSRVEIGYPDERHVIVQRGHAHETEADRVRHCFCLHVEVVQGLDVVGEKSDRRDHGLTRSGRASLAVGVEKVCG